MERVPKQVLLELGMGICKSYGIPHNHAKIVLNALIDADSCGKSTHGIVRLATYLERVQLGLMDAQATPMITHDTSALISADAQNSFGAVAMDWAIREIRSRVGQHGIVAIVLDHSNHVGALGYWSRSLAIDNSPLVAWIVSDASPRLPPTGGFDPILGNNPWSIAFPWDTGRAVVLDMANSVAAAGKIRKAMLEGNTIPDDWALDSQGMPTSDPKAALSGLLLPMAGYKGYSITLMMGMMANALSKAETIDVRNPYDTSGPQNTSQFMLAIDPSALYGSSGPDMVKSKVQAWVTRLKDARRQEGVEQIWLPGEQSDIQRADSEKYGVPLVPSSFESINHLAKSTGLKPL